MGKYLIRVESMDMDEAFDSKFADGIEADGFVILADNGEKKGVAIHKMSVDSISDIITHSDDMLMASILAKVKKEIVDLGRKGKAADALSRILGMD